MEIFPVTLEYEWEQGLILCLDEFVDEDELLRRANVKKGTYAAGILSKIYRNIFVHSVDIKYEFEKYYRLEYKTFDRYLERRLFLTAEESASIAAVSDKSVAILRYKPHQSFLSDEYGIDFLQRLLMPKGDT